MIATNADIDALFKAAYKGADIGGYLESIKPEPPVVTELGSVRYRGMEFRLLGVEPRKAEGLSFEVGL